MLTLWALDRGGDDSDEYVRIADNANCVDYVVGGRPSNVGCSHNLHNVKNVDCARSAPNLSDAELRWANFISRV